MTACIAADGFRMKPFVIVDRVTSDREIKYYGYDKSNVTLVSQEHAFMTRKLFDLWGDEVFLPAVRERRAQFGYDGRVLLLMDGLGSHHTESFLGKCAQEGIEVLFLVPHASDQIQPLDLLTFALMKQRFSSSKFTRLHSQQSNKLVRMLGAWFAASAPHHNVEAFISVGLVSFEAHGRFYLRVVRGETRRVRGLGEAGHEIPEAPLPGEARRRYRLATSADSLG
jgi:hypothetical protein